MANMDEIALTDWENSVPVSIRSDPLWKSDYYRLAMYLYDLVWMDCERLWRDFRGRAIVNQLTHCSGSVCANLEEAYGRGVGTPDYVRILRIALGEAHETRGWYFRSRHLLPDDLVERRLDIINQVIALLINTINRHRARISQS